jgi:pimeloyl-ACP methyl ester carboxylesterase
MLLCGLLLVSASAWAAEDGSGAVKGSLNSAPPEPCIVVGFLGGFVGHDDLRHEPVQLAMRLREAYRSGVSVLTFENRRLKWARREILERLDRDHDGIVDDEEKRNACIVLFGHSWGASTAVSLARDLQRASIPVMLTVQVDSVAKIGRNDSIIPANVADAINFYQSRGLLHGRSKIVAADATRTRILGNFQLDYHKQPVSCVQARWYSRWLTRTHVECECDPQLWSQVEAVIREHLSQAFHRDRQAELSRRTSFEE